MHNKELPILGVQIISTMEIKEEIVEEKGEDKIVDQRSEEEEKGERSNENGGKEIQK